MAIALTKTIKKRVMDKLDLKTLINAIFVLASVQVVFHLVVSCLTGPPLYHVTGFHEDGSGQLS